jgi:PAS domain S-box-containing protein
MTAHHQGDPAQAQPSLERIFLGHERAEELRKLLEITSELGNSGDPDEFFQKFVLRAGQFLHFERAAIAVVENGRYVVRWMAENGVCKAANIFLPEALTQRLLSSADPVWADDVSGLEEFNDEAVRRLGMKQFLAVPLSGVDHRRLGVLVVLDRCDHDQIEQEDVRRARVLASEIAVVMESTQNLHLARQHRERAENLMSLALELNSSLRLPQFVRSFTQRAADMLGARAAVLALAQRSVLETVIVHDPDSVPDKTLLRRLNNSLTELATTHTEAIARGTAEKMLGSQVATALGWKTVAIARLRSGDGELIGVLCLVDLKEDLSEADRNLLHALAAHASVALENARLFTRMDQANRHWVEIFDSITDFIVVHDENNRVLRVNRTLADFIGVRPSELIGVSMRAMVAMASDNSAQACPFCRVGLEGADEYIHPVLERTYLVSTSRIHGAMNEALQTIHVLKDITDRREAERRYRELFDTIQEGLFFSTPDGRFIEVNDALVRMLGYESREQLLQIDIIKQLYVNPEQREWFRSAIEESGIMRNYEESLRKRDGSMIHTLQNAFAVRDAQGRIIQYRGLILDITEQKNFQAELQRQRDFNNKILNATQSMIIVADTAGLISYANRRCYEAGGYNQEELLGRKLAELVAPGRRELIEEALHSTLRGLQVDNLELPILLGTGRVGQFAINLSPMRDESGQVASIVVVMTDITDAAMLQAKLMHTEKMAAVGQLVSGVAHEVNNPLTAILGFADLLIDHPEVPDFAKSDLRVILEEAQRTKQIVQNLLSFARQMPPQRKPVQVNAILRQTLALRSYDFANHGVKITETFASDLRDVVGDSHQLQQVFLNILNNAYDAVRESQHPGQILIETRNIEGMAEIVFRDNGPGILYPDRIFDPFFTTKEVGKGTGLGLSICYGIIREHAGEITCRNNESGSGATFIVRLPIATEQVLSQSAGVPA